MRTILVVDDEFANAQALRFILEDQGYEVLTAWTGEDALALLEAHPVDLMITDLRMPVMDGLELCRILHLRVSQPIPQVILMSSAVQPPQDDACHFQYYLNKPFNLATLSAAVQSCIGDADNA